MHVTIRCLVVVALLVTFLPDVEAQRRGRRDYNALDPEKFDRVARRLCKRAGLLTYADGELTFQVPDQRQASGFCQGIIGPVYKSAGRLNEHSRADYNCELTVGWKAEVEVVVAERRLRTLEFEREHLDLEELNWPFRLTEMFEASEQLELFFHDASAPVLFWLIQTEDFAQIIYLDGPEGIRYTGSSLPELAIRYDLSEVVREAKSFGLDLELLGTSNGAYEFIGKILSVSDDEFLAFREKWSALDSTDFEKRTRAIEEIRTDFEPWSALVAYAALGYGPSSVQFKASLLKALNPDDDNQTAVNIFDLVNAVVDNRLTEDPSLLIGRLNELQSGGDEKTIEQTVRQLEKVTEQQLGNDLEAWQTWLSENQKEESPVDAAISAEDYVYYGTSRSSLSRLASLTIGDDQQWKIDREAWREPFGVDDIQQLLTETRENFEATRLPGNWLLLGGGHDPRSVDFPQILLELYREQLNAGVRDRFGRDDLFEGIRGRGTFNRVIENSGFTVRMDQHPQSKDLVTNKQQYFSLNIHDPTSRESRLRLSENAGQMSLLLRSGPRNELIWLFQDKDGSSWLHRASASGLTSIQATDGRQLLENNQQLFEDSVYPVFAEMGVNVSETVGGPLDIKDVPLKVEAKK